MPQLYLPDPTPSPPPLFFQYVQIYLLVLFNLFTVAATFKIIVTSDFFLFLFFYFSFLFSCSFHTTGYSVLDLSSCLNTLSALSTFPNTTNLLVSDNHLQSMLLIIRICMATAVAENSPIYFEFIFPLSVVWEACNIKGLIFCCVYCWREWKNYEIFSFNFCTSMLASPDAVK